MTFYSSTQALSYPEFRETRKEHFSEPWSWRLSSFFFFFKSIFFPLILFQLNCVLLCHLSEMWKQTGTWAHLQYHSQSVWELSKIPSYPCLPNCYLRWYQDPWWNCITTKRMPGKTVKLHNFELCSSRLHKIHCILLTSSLGGKFPTPSHANCLLLVVLRLL